jgi:hypothetical protein
VDTARIRGLNPVTGTTPSAGSGSKRESTASTLNGGAQGGATPVPTVCYWMSREQRVRDNYALLHAQELALRTNSALGACQSLVQQVSLVRLRFR